MVSRFRSWWQQIKQLRVAIGVVGVVLVAVIALIIAGYWFDWTGFNGYNQVTIAHTTSGPSAGTVVRTEVYQPGKSLWDWMQLLFIPALLTIGAAWFTARQNHQVEIARQQHDNDLKIAIDNQREAAIQTYIDKMSELLLEKGLRNSQRGDEVRNIARVRTLTVLPKLDSIRKRSVLRFLQESGLLAKDDPIVDVSNANFREADLHHAKLRGVSLANSDLRETDLQKADLSGANLEGALLDGADLCFANLDGARITTEQLEKAKSLAGATMPDGSKHA